EIQWSRVPRSRTSGGLEELEATLADVRLNQFNEDIWVWKLDAKGIFSVKALSRWIEQRMGVADVNKTTWNNLVPRKVNVFVWRALNGILVRVELDKKGIDLDTLLCPGCDNVVESLDHVKELLCHKGKSSMGKESRLLWQTTIWVATYLVWKNRNNRVFKRKSENNSRLFNEIQLKTFEWICRMAKKWEIDWEKWLTRSTECVVVRNRSMIGDSAY
ncbi:reverse transcriptase domain, reverse transcriptase zinc-binding domain protein, partial [Tanacetum coccineum]